MITTKVDKEQLLETLKSNREKHEQDYKTAHKIWEGDVLKRLSQVRREAGKGDFSHVQFPLNSLPEPRSYLDEYDTAIARVEWEVMSTIELDQHEFGKYVLDQWSFSHDFIGTTSLYNSRG